MCRTYKVPDLVQIRCFLAQSPVLTIDVTLNYGKRWCRRSQPHSTRCSPSLPSFLFCPVQVTTTEQADTAANRSIPTTRSHLQHREMIGDMAVYHYASEFGDLGKKNSNLGTMRKGSKWRLWTAWLHKQTKNGKSSLLIEVFSGSLLVPHLRAHQLGRTGQYTHAHSSVLPNAKCLYIAMKTMNTPVGKEWQCSLHIG